MRRSSHAGHRPALFAAEFALTVATTPGDVSRSLRLDPEPTATVIVQPSAAFVGASSG